MMNFLRKYQYRIVLFMLIGFVIYIGLGMGLTFTARRQDSIAEVNGEKVPLHLFFSQYHQLTMNLKPQEAGDAAVRQQKRDEALRALVQNVVFAEEAKHYDIAVPDQQVVISLTQVPAFQEKGTFSPQRYSEALGSVLRMSPKEFEEQQRNSIAFFKLRWLIQSCIKVTEPESQALYAFQHGGKMTHYEKDQKEFEDKLWQEKVSWVLSRWLNQLGQQVRVKTHFDVLEGGGQ